MQHGKYSTKSGVLFCFGTGRMKKNSFYSFFTPKARQFSSSNSSNAAESSEKAWLSPVRLAA